LLKLQFFPDPMPMSRSKRENAQFAQQRRVSCGRLSESSPKIDQPEPLRPVESSFVSDFDIGISSFASGLSGLGKAL
jgi:hypothetical protein